MQAIARVNRTFRDKPGGLIVDYLGIATNLRQALAEYSPADRDQAGVPIEQMVAAMLEKHDIVRGLLHGCAYDADPQLPAAQRMAAYATVLDVVMSDPDRQTRYLDQVLALTKAYALCASRDEALAIRNDVRLFGDVRAAILKLENPDSGRAGEDVPSFVELGWRSGVNSMRRLGQFRGSGPLCLGGRGGAGRRRAGASACSP